MFPEGHPRFMGTYWGAVSWPAVAEVVESAELVLTIGCVWTDYSTVGYSLLLKPEKVGPWVRKRGDPLVAYLKLGFQLQAVQWKYPCCPSCRPCLILQMTSVPHLM